MPSKLIKVTIPILTIFLITLGGPLGETTSSSHVSLIQPATAADCSGCTDCCPDCDGSGEKCCKIENKNTGEIKQCEQECVAGSCSPDQEDQQAGC